MNAREILRAEFGSAPNFMTPDVLRRVSIRHPDTGVQGAAELSEGTGLPTREQRNAGTRVPIYGVSVVWVREDGSTQRASTDEPHGSRVFHDEPTDEPWPHRGTGYTAALDYMRTLGARV